jgi:hypothetical protein
VAGGNGSAGGGRGGSAASAANGNGGAGSGDSGSRSSGGAETPPSTSANGCSCRLGSPVAPKAWMVALLFVLCLRLARRKARGEQDQSPIER